MRHFMMFYCTVYSDSLQELTRLPAYSAPLCHSEPDTEKGNAVGWEVGGRKTSRGKKWWLFSMEKKKRFVQKILKKKKDNINWGGYTARKTSGIQEACLETANKVRQRKWERWQHNRKAVSKGRSDQWDRSWGSCKQRKRRKKETERLTISQISLLR